MTCLIVGAEYNAQKTLWGVPAMVMAHVKHITINYRMFVNPFATNAVKTAQIHSWWYEEIARIYSAQRNLDPPCANILVVTHSSQRFFPLLTLCIMLLP